MATQSDVFDIDRTKYGFRDPERYTFKSKKGLSRQVVEEISYIKGEPDWMLERRLRALEIFLKKPMPTWGGDLSELNFDEIYYYVRPDDKKATDWDDVPEYIRDTFDKLGIPEAERRFLAGVGAQYESEMVYHNLQKKWEEMGVIFVDSDTAVQEYPDLVKQYFGTIIPAADNKFAALNTAVWSGGSFIYVPEGVNVEIPLQAYFRINAENMGQFERTLIIVERGAKVHYVEGCTAPIYSTHSLHSAVVEVIAKPGAHVRYTTIQNWANNIYNLVTKRSVAQEGATVEWVDGNIGCLTGDALVFKNDDLVPIADVQVGDHVWSLTPEFEIVSSRVRARKVNAPRPVYALTLQNNRQVRTTANHPFLVLRKRGKMYHIRWLSLEQIEEGDYVAIAGQIPDAGQPHRITFGPQRRSLKSFRWPKQTDERLMWLLGFYLGDGYKDRQRVYFAVPESDPASEQVVSLLDDLFGLQPGRRGTVLRIGSVAFVDWLDQIGFSGTAKTKQLPAWVFRLPHAQKQALIEGYIAADGHRRKGHRQLSITSANQALLEQIRDLAVSIGMNPSKISVYHRREKLALGKEVNEYVTYYLYFSNEELDAPIHFVRLRDKEYAGEEVTYDIEVEGTANFIANGILAHNSKLTMKYPAIYLMGPGARGETLSIAFAGRGQHQDAGAKMVHAAPHTTSTITSKSISKDGGRATYRGLAKVMRGAVDSKVSVRCDALILDEHSRSDTIPHIEVDEERTHLAHEATVGKIGEDQLFYLMSRGLKEAEAMSMIVMGFMEPFTKELPLEYAVELNRLIQLEMEGSVG